MRRDWLRLVQKTHERVSSAITNLQKQIRQIHESVTDHGLTW